MGQYRVTVKIVYLVTAENAKAAERKVQERVNAPEDNPPGQLTNWSVRAKECGT